MKKKHIILLFCLLLSFMLLITGCQGTKIEGTQTVSNETEINTEEKFTEVITESTTEIEASDETRASASTDDMFTDRDLEGTYDTKEASNISLSDDDVIISKEGVYVLSGTLKNGSIIVETDKSDKVQLVLNNVNISNDNGAAIYVKSADKVFITSPKGTTNTLTNGGTFEAIDENNIDAVIFSKDDLVINGPGKLIIESPAAHGIVSKNDLKICGSEIEINSYTSAMDGKDSLRISGGKLDITSSGDCLKSSNEEEDGKGFIYITGGTFNINAGDDGIYAKGQLTIKDGSFSINSKDDAIHAGKEILIIGGTFNINAGDDGFHTDTTIDINGGNIIVESSYEGIEGSVVNINGGNISVVSSDDGINAAGGTDSSENRTGWFGGKDFFGGEGSADYSINITGGYVKVNAQGDGIDSNGYIVISGGETYIDGPDNSGNGALDSGLNATISGGKIIAVGASGMAETFSADSTQGSIMVNGNTYQAGTEISLLNDQGETLMTYQSEKTFSSVVISCPEIVIGSTYTLCVGNDSTVIEMSSISYSNGGGMGGGRNPGGGGRGKDQGGMGGGQMPGGGGQMPDDQNNIAPGDIPDNPQNGIGGGMQPGGFEQPENETPGGTL